MELLENSLIGGSLLRLWLVLTQRYEDSAIHALMVGLSHWWSGLFRNSIIMAFITREGSLPKAWRRSLACAIVETVANLPAALLHWIYCKCKPVFDNSFFALLAFSVGEQVPAAIGWMMLAILAIPYDNWDNRYSLMGYLLMLLLFLAGGMRKRSLRLDFKSVGPYALCFAFAVCLAWPVSYFSAVSLRFLFFHITCMLCVVVTVSAVERPEQLVRLAGMASLAMAVTSLYAVYQRIDGVDINYSYVDMTLNKGMPGRVFAMFDNPNAFAQVLVMLIPLGVALLLCSRTGWGRLGALMAVGLGCLALGMTYARACWVGALAAAVVFLFLWKRKLIPACLLLGLLALPMLPDTIFNRILTIFNFEDSSTASRFPLYEAALRLIAARPIRGAGLGTDAVRLAIKDLNLYHGVAPFVHAHDIYLQVWLETGLLGVVSFLAATLSGIKSAARAVKAEGCPAPVRLITIGGAASMVGILVCGIADYVWNYPRVMVLFWFVFAVMLAGVKLAKKSK